MGTRSVATKVISVVVGVLFVLGASATSGATRAAATKMSPLIMTCGGKTVYEPSSYVISCADANSSLVSIHWTWWTHSFATAIATYSLNDCTPDCAAGKFHSYAARVSFSTPRLTKYGTLYSRLRVIYLVGSKTHTMVTTLPLRPL
jgi:hypothetical protein